MAPFLRKESETMSEERIVRITPWLSIPMHELGFRFSQSGGPGGQHVNKTETKVWLSFDVAQSPSLKERHRATLLAKLASRLDQHGVLQLSCQETRSQRKNRERVIERFQLLLAEALKVQKPRRPTKPRRGAVERRLQRKKQTGQRKKERQRKWDNG